MIYSAKRPPVQFIFSNSVTVSPRSPRRSPPGILTASPDARAWPGAFHGSFSQTSITAFLKMQNQDFRSSE